MSSSGGEQDLNDSSSDSSGTPPLRLPRIAPGIQLLQTPPRSRQDSAAPSDDSSGPSLGVSRATLSTTSTSASELRLPRIPFGGHSPSFTPSRSRLPPTSTTSSSSGYSSNLSPFTLPSIPYRASPTQLSTPTRGIQLNSGSHEPSTMSSSPRKRGRARDGSESSTDSGIRTPRPLDPPVLEQVNNVRSPSVEYGNDYYDYHHYDGREPSIYSTPSPPPPVEQNPDALDLIGYWDYLRSFELARSRINEFTWVIEHYNQIPRPGTFHHVTAERNIDSDLVYSCDCSAGRNGVPCLHVAVLKRNWATFDDMESLFDERRPESALIASNHFDSAAWYSVLVNSDLRDRSDGKRVVVRHIKGTRWSCPRCKNSTQVPCDHIRRAQAYKKSFRALGPRRSDAEEGDGGESGGDSSDSSDGEEEEGEADEIQRIMGDDLRAAGLGDDATDDQREQAAAALLQKSSVSNARIPPPSCFSLPTDQPVERVPWQGVPLFKLSPSDKCKCGAPASDAEPIKVLTARIFSLNGSFPTQVEVAACSRPCRTKHRWTVGPDLGSYQLFNWSNSLIFDHILMHTSLSMMATSPTPISAMHATFSNTYEEISRSTGTRHDFPSKKTWNLAFLGYLRLLDVDVPMHCSVCGNHPATVVADGVSISFDQDRLTSNLRPPTTPGLEQRPEVKPVKDLPFLPTPKLRRTVQSAARVARPGSQPLHPDEMDDVGLEAAIKLLNEERVADEEAKRRVNSIAKVLEEIRLSVENEDVNSPFTHRGSLKATLEFIEQLGAHESTLQLCPLRLCDWIDRTSYSTEWNEDDTNLQHQSRLLCPSLFNLLVNLRDSTFPPSLRKIVHMLSIHVQSSYVKLHRRQNDPPVIQLSPPQSPLPINQSEPRRDPDWLVNGSRYGMDRIRERPLYPSIKGETKAGSKGLAEPASCQKFFSQYSKRRQTGGILALWCPHGICYGFHIIPKAEGRNDVFSAIWCHWPQAPSKLLYDYACALMPYCMLREPQYWVDTQILIDQFHQNNHNKCSAACFASTYMRDNPEWRAVNTSAAECGNSGLARIRKSVSYADQRTATLIVSKFIDVWNRRRVLDLGRLAARAERQGL